MHKGQPSSVLQHTHIMKASYQKNMMWSWCIVLPFGVCAAILFFCLDDGSQETVIIPLSPRVQQSVNMRFANPPVLPEEGKTRVVPKASIPAFATLLPTPDGLDIELTATGDSIGDSLIAGTGYGNGEGYDFFAPKPEAAPIVPINLPRPPAPQEKIVISIDKSAIPDLRVPYPRTPRKGINTKAKAIVDVFWNSKGAITKTEVILEEPRGMGFADALREAVDESKLFPGKNAQGEPLPGKITLTYEWGATHDTLYARGVRLTMEK